MSVHRYVQRSFIAFIAKLTKDKNHMYLNKRNLRTAAHTSF